MVFLRFFLRVSENVGRVPPLSDETDDTNTMKLIPHNLPTIRPVVSRTLRKRVMAERLKAQLERRKLRGTVSAVDLLNAEAARIKKLSYSVPNLIAKRNMSRVEWAMAFAAAWLASRTAPELIKKWKEI